VIAGSEIAAMLALLVVGVFAAGFACGRSRERARLEPRVSYLQSALSRERTAAHSLAWEFRESNTDRRNELNRWNKRRMLERDS